MWLGATPGGPVKSKTLAIGNMIQTLLCSHIDRSASFLSLTRAPTCTRHSSKGTSWRPPREACKVMFRRASRAVTSLLFASFCCWAQSHDGAQPLPLSTNEKSPLTGHLTPVETSVTGEVATGFAGPFVCDGDGNLYLGSESTGVRAIRKLNPKGELVALFDPSSNPDVQVQVTGNFSVSVDGEPHVLGFLTKGISRYVLVFKSVGTYKGNIKLDPGFPWIPASLGGFSNESLLVTGEAYDRDRNAPMLPFTGIFRADGKLLKEFNLEDDDSIHDMAVAHHARVNSTN